MVHHCCAYGCKEKFVKGSGIGFFRFPCQRSKRIKWTSAVRRKDFVPSSSTRICGKHFITGRPSKDINHPDYVPTIFSDRNSKGSRSTKKLLCEFEVMPVMNTDCDLTSDSDKSEEGDNVNFISEFESKVENSSLINAETIRLILQNDEASKVSTTSSKNEQSFNPRLFTFIDCTGRTLAKFEEQRVRKDALQLIQSAVSAKHPRETVQIIVDKKQAKTISVDREAICVSNTPELCYKNIAERKCIVDVYNKRPYIESVNESNSRDSEIILIKNQPESDEEVENESNSRDSKKILVKNEPESDEEDQHTEDFINVFVELKDSKQENNEFAS